MNGHIERHVSIAADRDGTVVAKVTKTIVTVGHVEPAGGVISTGDGSGNGGSSEASASRKGRSADSGSYASDCFDVDALCDAREKAVIEVLRAYLRPQTAPACLIDRLHHCLGDDMPPTGVERRSSR
ncbi:hypothetical protein Uis1B_0474 [Bifidobacterium margollesii]|uniref:Uncharacterized protein n=1 Tax=Bifidobacterium margollesii TaxID=2020964 RepID=A0A2N5JBR9_9BIFI|nr:hypothetical protein [Bifidobacterium margollesii]PLS31653.1 hypothetical protein Uis1B_0474 [Bifidobacterium margollesii]